MAKNPFFGAPAGSTLEEAKAFQKANLSPHEILQEKARLADIRVDGMNPPPADGITNFPGEPGGSRTEITTSTPAVNELGGIDQQIEDLGLELPEQQEDTSTEQTALIKQQLETSTAQIEEQRRRRLATQQQAGAAILGESRAALAGLGILSSEPGLVSASSAQQYLDDVKIGNQRQIDNINAEMDLLLRVAKDAKDAGDLAIAQSKIDEANELRKERNDLRIQASQEGRAIREAERRLSAQEFNEWLSERQEKRAGEAFSISKAQDALAILEKTSFQDFANYLPSEIDQIELAIGLPKGTLANYAANAAKLEALGGYTSKFITNKLTGEVVVVYTRLNPETGEIETMEESLGFIGERFKPTAAPRPKTITLAEAIKLGDPSLAGKTYDVLEGITSPIDNIEGIDWTKSKEVKKAVIDMNSQLKTIIGDDGFVSPDDYTIARNAWIQANGSPTVFDTKFKGFRNPNNPNYITVKE